MIRIYFILFTLALFASGCSKSKSSKNDSLKQVSTFDTLKEDEALSDSGDWEVIP